MDEENLDQMVCADHEDTPASFFCQECEHCICNSCCDGKHKFHGHFSLDDVQEMQERLKLFLSACDEQEEKSERRHFEIENIQRNIESAKEMDLQRIDDQAEQVKQQLEGASQEEKDFIRRTSNEQQMTVQNEISQLNKLDSCRNELLKTALELKTNHLLQPS